MGFQDLPEGCVAAILSLTTPADACRLSLVSKLFYSAAGSDALWDHFLPSDVVSIISQSSLLTNSPSRKALYLALSDSDHPILLDQGKKNVKIWQFLEYPDSGMQSFQLDRKSGKKIYMFAARSLSITWGDTPQYWAWTTLPESRFPEVAKLLAVCWLEIRVSMNTLPLSPSTQYAAYLVFKMIDARGFHNLPVELCVGVANFGGETRTKSVCLDPNLEREGHHRVVRLQRPNVRSDGWLEIEMGEFFNSGIEDEDLQLSVMEIRRGNWKRGLTLEGIEVRPKEDN